jgi:hypothetical protein
MIVRVNFILLHGMTTIQTMEGKLVIFYSKRNPTFPNRCLFSFALQNWECIKESWMLRIKCGNADCLYVVEARSGDTCADKTRITERT